jgi:hypothetical protein
MRATSVVVVTISDYLSACAVVRWRKRNSCTVGRTVEALRGEHTVADVTYTHTCNAYAAI